MIRSCKKCMTVVDTENAPVKTSAHGARGEMGAFTQKDVTCPKCGGLILREIGGVEAKANGADPRATKPLLEKIVGDKSKEKAPKK